MTKKRKMLHRPTQFTKGDLEHAAESAREMVAEDATLQHLVNFLIIARRIYMVGRSALDNEIRGNWEVDDPELIVQTLVLSCQEKANEKFKILALQQGVLQGIVPVLDIFVQQARETGRDIDEDSTSENTNGTRPNEECDVSGSDQGAEAGCGHTGTEAQQDVEGRHVAGESPEGDRQGQRDGDALADNRLRAGTDVD